LVTLGELTKWTTLRSWGPRRLADLAKRRQHVAVLSYDEAVATMWGQLQAANRQLTWEQLERGWSHDELCAQIKSSMRDAGEADTGLTGSTVRRWETSKC
jgi:hypothetical protein